MPDRKPTPITRLLGGLLLLSALTAEARAETWYKVEMLVFSNSGGSNAEEWDATPALSYPRKTRLLVDPDHPAARASLQEQNPLVPNAASTGYNPVFPAPFITLPASELEFRGAASRMQSSGRYRKLFHEAWTQPIPGRSRALPIVLDHSGDGGPWPELQGSVKLYISRYIYLETNLWLNTSGDYLHSDWQMPAPPLAPPSLVPVDPFSGAVQSRVTAASPAPEGLPVIAESMGAPASESEPANNGSGSEPGTTRGSQQLGPEYPYRHAVLLNQTRRMRSSEVNYIDHPMFGVVVKVTRVAVAADPAGDAEADSASLAQ